MQQRIGGVSGILKPRCRDLFYQCHFSENFYVSENFNSEEEVRNL
jgi:hypothetical protein